MDTPGPPRQFCVGSTLYCLLPHPAARLSRQQAVRLGKPDSGLLPLTIITWTRPLFTDHDVQSLSEQFSTKDDVWCHDFLSGEPGWLPDKPERLADQTDAVVILLLQPHDLRCEVTSNTAVLTISKSNLRLANGPYVLCKATRQIHCVCRLYEDTHHAFVSGILPRTRSKDDFRTLEPPTRNPSSLGLVQVPVPSRLYHEPCESKPLAGVSMKKSELCARGAC
jgi:hypothetical protein